MTTFKNLDPSVTENPQSPHMCFLILLNHNISHILFQAFKQKKTRSHVLYESKSGSIILWNILFYNILALGSSNYYDPT